MTRTLAAAVALLLLITCAGFPAMSQRFETHEQEAAVSFDIDIAHSMIIFRVRHFDVSNFYGRINQPKGSFTIDPENPASSSLRVTIDIDNIDAGNVGRDQFLKGPQFFNVREFPSAEFRSTSFEKSETEGEFAVKGKFTMRGVTKDVSVRLFDYTEKQTDRFGYRGGFEAHFTIKRSEFGMTEMIDEGLLGDEVTIIATIEGVRAEG